MRLAPLPSKRFVPGAKSIELLGQEGNRISPESLDVNLLLRADHCDSAETERLSNSERNA